MPHKQRLEQVIQKKQHIQSGEENLKKPELKEYIERAQEKRQKRTEVTQDMVINELAAIAFSNATDFARVKDGFVRIDETDELDEKVKKAIVGIKEGKNGIEISMANKMQALELLGRHLGMFKDKLELSKSTGEIAEEIDKYVNERAANDDK